MFHQLYVSFVAASRQKTRPPPPPPVRKQTANTVTAQTASRRDMRDATVMHAEVVEAMIERTENNEEHLVYCKNVVYSVFLHCYS